MSREYSGSLETTLSQDNIYIFLFVEMFFNSGTLRLWTGIGDYEFLGNTYLGVGSLGEVSNIQESGDLVSNGITLTLNGISSDLLQYVDAADYRSRNMSLHLMTTDAGGNYDSHIKNLYNGLMDVITIDEQGNTITVTCEHRLVNLEIARPIRLSASQQQFRYPGDKGLDMITGLINKQIFWGRASPVIRNSYSGPVGGGYGGGGGGENYYGGGGFGYDSDWYFDYDNPDYVEDNFTP